MSDKKFPTISHERLVKIFEKGSVQEQLDALNRLKEFVAKNVEAERDKHEKMVSEFNYQLNQLNGNV